MRISPVCDAFWRRCFTRRTLREIAGLTQAQVAEYIGTDPSTVARWEAGTRRGAGGRHVDGYRRILESIEAAAAARFEFLAIYGEYLEATHQQRQALAGDMLDAFTSVLNTQTERWPLNLDTHLPRRYIPSNRRAG